MKEFICKICNNNFSSLQSLEKHENRKFKCSIDRKFKCNSCLQSFKFKKNLNNHIEKKDCKILQSTNDVTIAIKDIIINNSLNIDAKIKFIKKINNLINDNEIKEIIESKVELNTKIILLNTKTPATVITNSNNTTTTNNIQFNNFGNENIDYLTEKFFKKLLTNNYGENIFLKLSDEIYLNQKHPENQTIKIDNLNNKFCKVKEKNKWITTTKEEALKKIFNRAVEIVNNCLAENEDIISDEKINIINGYIEKDFEDELIVDAVKKLALNIYNFYNSSMI
jgi:hypothetical protein